MTTLAAPTNFARALNRTLILPTLLLAALAGVLLDQVRLLQSASRWVEHTDQVIAQANRVLTLLVDQETGLRGFLLHREPVFLEPYQASRRTLPASLDQLGDLVRDNPAQVRRAGEIRSHSTEWEEHARSVLDGATADVRYRSAAASRDGKQRMDTLRGLLREFISVEEQLRVRRTAAVSRATTVVVASALALTAVLGLAAAWLLRRQITGLNRTYAAALTEAVGANEQLRRLQTVTDAALAHLRLEDLLNELLERVCVLLQADTAALLLLDEGQGVLLTRAARGLEQEVAEPVPIPLGQGFAGRAALSVGPFALSEVKPEELVSPILRARGVRSLLGARLAVDGRLLGVVHVGSLQPRRFTDEELSLIQLVADRVALAVDHARLFAAVERQVEELEVRVRERTEELEATNAELEAFSATVSHDLRAPLRAIQGFTQALEEDYGACLDGEGREFSAAILTSAARMDRLIEDLLSYSRLGRLQIPLQQVQLATAVEEAVAQLPPDQQAAVRVDGSLPQVRAFQPVLVQVLTNLLANAVKFVAPGTAPEVRVSASVRGGRVRLWIEDNGIGIDPAHHARIFSPFERLHGIESYSGTGIGLAIVRRAVERMNGAAGVESQLGQGSRFWIELPG